MSPRLLTTLPGDIPGLRRDGTVMHHAHYGRGVAFSDLRGQPIILTADGRCLTLSEGWEIDLTDLTGRWHAALFVDRHRASDPEVAGFNHSINNILFCAMRGDDMTLEAIDTLARLVLRLAGRTA